MIRINANTFKASAALKGGFVCLPMAKEILFMKGWRLPKVLEYCNEHNWEIKVMDDC